VKKKIQSFINSPTFVGFVLIMSGLFVYFCPEHIMYHDLFFLIFLLSLGLFCILVDIFSNK